VTYPTAQEFEAQRRVIRERYGTLFSALEEQLRYVGEDLPRRLPDPMIEFDLALIAHLARASKTALGIVVASENGFGEMAMMGLRLLGETMVSAYWMSLDPEARADQFIEFTKLEQLAVAHFARDTMGWEDPELELPAELQDEERAAAVRRRFPNEVQGWFQVGMNVVIRDIEPCWGEPASRQEFMQVAKILHYFGDRHSHLGAYDTLSHLDAPEGALRIRLGAGNEWIPQALVTAAWVYGQVFDLAAEPFQSPDLESWRRRWQLLLSRCRPLSEERRRNVGRNDPCPCGSGFKYKRCHLGVPAMEAV
jgi:hypothetical protein